MLTITFISKDCKTVVSCDMYETHDKEGGGTRIVAIKGFGGEYASETFIISPNSKLDFSVAYVTNMAGKTIDRIGG